MAEPEGFLLALPALAALLFADPVLRKSADQYAGRAGLRLNADLRDHAMRSLNDVDASSAPVDRLRRVGVGRDPKPGDSYLILVRWLTTVVRRLIACVVIASAGWFALAAALIATITLSNRDRAHSVVLMRSAAAVVLIGTASASVVAGSDASVWWRLVQLQAVLGLATNEDTFTPLMPALKAATDSLLNATSTRAAVGRDERSRSSRAQPAQSIIQHGVNIALLIDRHEPGKLDASAASDFAATIGPLSPNRVAYVSAQPIRFPCGLAGNITLRRTGPADRAAIVEACGYAGLESMLERFSGGLDVPLSTEFPGGTDISTDEWRRVAIARASFRVMEGASVLVIEHLQRSDILLANRLRRVRPSLTLVGSTADVAAAEACDLVMDLRTAEPRS